MLQTTVDRWRPSRNATQPMQGSSLVSPPTIRTTVSVDSIHKQFNLTSIAPQNLFEIYVFKVAETITDIPIELPCLGDLENPSQLPVHEVLEGTDDCVLYFLKFLHYLCFRDQGIHFWYSYWATMFGWLWKSSLTPGTGGTWRYWWFCFTDFPNFLNIYVFEV